MATSTDKKTTQTKKDEPDNLSEAQRRDLHGASKKDETNQATRMGHSPSQQFGKLLVEHDAAAGTVTFVGADGSRIAVDESDFDAMVVAHRDDSVQRTGNSPPVVR